MNNRTHKNKTLALLLTCFACLSASMLWAQFGGEMAFPILSVAPTARAAALGGSNVSVKDGDASFAYQNPSLIDSSYNGQINAGFNILYGITKGANKSSYAQYVRQIKKNTYSFALHYINYGSAAGYDEFGNPQADVTASDYVACLSASRNIKRNLNFGASLKPIVSHLASYTSIGLAADAGLTYNDTAHRFSIGLVGRNFGYQLKNYTSASRASLPMQIDLGFSKRFAHAPLRVSLTYTNIQTFDLSYQTTEKVSLLHTEQTSEKSKLDQFGSKFLSHWVVGVELLLPRNFYLASGLNFRNRTDLKPNSSSGLTGFSFGAGIKFKRFFVNYAYSAASIAGGSSYLSVRTNLESFTKKSAPVGGRM